MLVAQQPAVVGQHDQHVGQADEVGQLRAHQQGCAWRAFQGRHLPERKALVGLDGVDLDRSGAGARKVGLHDVPTAAERKRGLARREAGDGVAFGQAHQFVAVAGASLRPAKNHQRRRSCRRRR